MFSDATRSPHRALSAMLALVAGLVIACPGTGADGDPCEPGGHLHRGADASEDFCHCSPGWLPAEDERACHPDPEAEAGFPFEHAETDACATAANGLAATVAHGEPPAPVNAFDTVYTLELAEGPDGFSGRFAYDAPLSGKALLYLGGEVPFSFKEGLLPVPHEEGPPPSTCDTFHSVIGIRLLDGVRYTLEIGPTPDATATLLIRLIP
ncbi:MAG TPA: hypothetical protein VK013_13895 [Myxococcaceae bacterium]|nr:hypothetical protein [Myxococcaceae bacterium]